MNTPIPSLASLNALGRDALAHGGAVLWQSTLLIVVLGLLDLALRRRVRATLRYALWLLVPLKLLLPPGLALPTGAGWWLTEPLARRFAAPPAATSAVADYQVTFPADGPRPHGSGPGTGLASTVPPPTLGIAGSALVVWVAGSVGLLGWMWLHSLGVLRLVRAARPASPELADLLRRCARELGLRRVPRLLISPARHSPALCGCLRPAILLPESLVATLLPAQQRAVLLHELAHQQRRDPWLNVVQALVQVAYWWHPLVWVTNTHLRRLREAAVDEQVMLAHPNDFETYPATLVEIARHCLARPTLALGFVGILESRHALEARIRRLVELPPPRSARLGLPGWLLVVAVGAGTLPMAGADPTPVTPVAATPTLGPGAGAGLGAGLGAPSPAPSPAPTGVTGLDPALLKRYGLQPGTNAQGQPTGVPAGIDPILARRYGLLAATPTPATAPAPAPTAAPAELHTRTFRVDPRTFTKALDAVMGSANANPGAPAESQLQARIRAFFQSAGVDFAAPDDKNPGDGRPPAERKAVFLNEVNGILFVRATVADLDVIEHAIQALNVLPPQIMVDAVIYELMDDAGPLLGLLTPANPIPMPTPPATGGGLGAPAAGVFPGAGAGIGAGVGAGPLPTNSGPAITGILNPDQRTAIQQALSQNPRVRLVASPRIITVTGRPAQIAQVQFEGLVTEPGGPTNQVPVGPILDILPYATADDLNIDLTVVASLNSITRRKGDTSGVGTLTTANVSSSVRVAAGHTVVMIPSFAANPPAPGTTTPVRQLLVLATPRFVDPAGQARPAPTAARAPK